MIVTAGTMLLDVWHYRFMQKYRGRPKGGTQVRALSKMRPKKSDNKRQSFDKITQVQNID